MLSVHSRYRFLYLSGLFVALYYAMTVYINASFLSAFFDQQTIDGLYIIGAGVSVLSLIFSSRFINLLGNKKSIHISLITEACALVALAFSRQKIILAIAFILYQALGPFLLFCLDIFFEQSLEKKNDTEQVRGSYLTSMNVAFVAAPIMVGLLINYVSFSSVYILSAACIGILYLLTNHIRKNHNHREPYLHEDSFQESMRILFTKKNVLEIFSLNLLLQIFFASMVIFSATYLRESIGLSFSSIGLIFTIMLTPFVIFERPLGAIFKKKHNEKEVLFAGFIIMALSCFVISSTDTKSIFIWALILFISRIGASFVEVASEAAFYKNISAHDTGLVSIFRMASPIAYIIVPYASSFFIHIWPITGLYFLLGMLMIFGATVTISLRGLQRI